MVKALVPALLALATFTSPATAQNPQGMFNLFNGVMRSAITQETAKEWRRVPAKELVCIDRKLHSRGESVQFYIRRGVGPASAPIAEDRAKCRHQVATTGNQPTSSNVVDASTSDQNTSAEQYVIQGVRLGDDFTRSTIYSKFNCSPSSLFKSFTWCEWRLDSDGANGKFVSITSALHSSDGRVYYMSRAIEPAVFGSGDINREIERLSKNRGQPKVLMMPHKAGLPSGVIASWGKVVLEPLDADSVQMEAAGKSPSKGYLVDFLGDFKRSAQQGSPIYLLTGGAGMLWIATYDETGRGRLRFVFVDASKFMSSINAPQVATQSSGSGNQAFNPSEFDGKAAVVGSSPASAADPSNPHVADQSTHQTPDAVPSPSNESNAPPIAAADTKAAADAQSIKPMADPSTGKPGYMTDARNGCAVWIWSPHPGEEIEWDGPCVSGKAEGSGVLRTTVPENPNFFATFNGSMVDGKLNGQGTFTTPDGTKYTGEFKDGKANGQGTLTAPDGTKYTGEFKDGKFERIAPNQSTSQPGQAQNNAAVENAAAEKAVADARLAKLTADKEAAEKAAAVQRAVADKATADARQAKLTADKEAVEKMAADKRVVVLGRHLDQQKRERRYLIGGGFLAFVLGFLSLLTLRRFSFLHHPKKAIPNETPVGVPPYESKGKVEVCATPEASDVIDQLAKFAQLRTGGILTDQEFMELKTSLIRGPATKLHDGDISDVEFGVQKSKLNSEIGKSRQKPWWHPMGKTMYVVYLCLLALLYSVQDYLGPVKSMNIHEFYDWIRHIL